MVESLGSPKSHSDPATGDVSRGVSEMEPISRIREVKITIRVGVMLEYQ